MGTYEFNLSLNIRHPTIDPARITHMLGIEPQHAWRAGDPRRSPAGEGLQGVYRESYWTARLIPEPQVSSEGVSIEAYLMQTVSLLHRAQDFLEQLNIEGGVAELHVSLFARGDFRLGLIADALALLGRLRLAIVLDVHLHAADPAPAAPAN
jgi:hypothetical protein